MSVLTPPITNTTTSASAAHHKQTPLTTSTLLQSPTLDPTMSTMKPISPQPSKPILNKLFSSSSSIQSSSNINNPTPRTTPFTIYNDFNDDEADETASILSEAISIATPDIIDSFNNYKTQTPTQTQTPSFSKHQNLNLKYKLNSQLSTKYQQLLPIFNSTDPSNLILSQFFSNQIFYANNLVQLTQHFLNNEFDFDHTLILNPIDMSTLQNCHYDSIIKHLNDIYNYSIDLTSTITIFNAMIDKVNIIDVTLDNLVLMKTEFDNLINNHLSEQVHHLLDLIIEELYEYNLLIDDLSEQQQETKQEPTDTGKVHTIHDFYHSIETMLQLKTPKLTKSDVCKFHKLLSESIIDNKAWGNLVEEIKKEI